MATVMYLPTNPQALQVWRGCLLFITMSDSIFIKMPAENQAAKVSMRAAAPELILAGLSLS